MSDLTPTRKTWFLSFAGVLLFFLFLTSAISSLGCVCLEDAWEQYWPWYFYLGDSVSHGRFPLWDPYSSCGFPFHANPQAGTFYPIYLLFGWLFGGGYKVFVALWLGHWFFALVGCFLLAKRLGLDPLGAFAASVTFGFSGFFLGHAEHTSFINAAAYVPWVILVLDLACEKSMTYALLAGVALGTAGLSGYPGIFWYSLVMIVLWGPLRYGLSWRTAAVACLTAAVAGVVVSPAYVSFLVEGSGYTDRVGALDLHTACDSGRFPLSAMTSLLIPQFVVNFREWIDSDISMTDGYFGLLGLTGLAVTVLYEPLRKRWKWLLVWMLIGWLFSLGTVGGIRVAAYYLVPVLRYTRHSALFREFWILGGAILAGVLIDNLLNANEQCRSRIVSLAIRTVAVLLFGCACIVLWIAVVPQFGPSTIHGLRAAALQLGMGAGCLIALVLYSRGLFTRTVFACAITLILVADLAAHFSGNQVLVCAKGNGAAVAAEFERLNAARVGVPLTGTEKRHDAPRFHPNQGLFDREGYVRSYNPASSPDYDFLVGGSIAGSAAAPVRTPFLSVLERGPRFWLTPEAAYADIRDRKALAQLQNTAFPSAVPLFIHSKVPAAIDTQKFTVQPGTYGKVQVVEFQPESIRLHVESPGDAWLFCAERYAPGWKAYVDGHAALLCRADFCFRAVKVPAGNHEVRLQYEPRFYKPFWLLSWAVIFSVIGGFALMGIGRIRRH